jgi:hypothetical protein
MEEVDDHYLRCAPARLPSALLLVRRLLPLHAIRFLGVLVVEKENLD